MRTAIVLILAAALFLAGCTFNMPGGQQQAPVPKAPSQPAAPSQPSQPTAPAQAGNATAGSGGCSFTGGWDTNWGEMFLVQNGSNVTGTYTYDDGRINGTVSGLTMSGMWSENADENAYEPPDNAGDAIFNLSTDCKSIDGLWRYGSEGEYSGDWSGTRKQ